jgi:hypothetical protein
MPLFPEFTIAIVLGALLLFYLVFRFLNSRPGYRSRKNELLEKFQSLRGKSIKMQEALSNHILTEHVLKDNFVDNYTYGDFLKYLQKNHIQYLSDKNYAKIKNSDNRLLLKQTQQVLEEQQNKLVDAESKLQIVLQKKS